jgi:hypothetical protein
MKPSTTLAVLAAVLLFAAASPLAAEDAGNPQTDTRLSNRGLEFRTEGFSMRISSWAQFRFTHQQEVANGNDGTNGRNFNNFRIRNAKTTFRGHIYHENFQYRLTFNWVAGGNEIVERAFFLWTPMQEVNVGVGQTKPLWNWEYNHGAGRQMFTDRGYVNNVFNLNYAKGVWVDGRIGEDVPWLMYSVGLFNGVLRADDDFRNRDRAIIADRFQDGRVDTDLMFNARVETHPLGQVEGAMYDRRSEDTRHQLVFAVGLGVNYFISGFRNEALRPDTSGSPETASGRSRTYQDTWAITVDGNLRWHGLSVHAALYWRHTEFHNRGSNDFNPGRPSKSGISNLTDLGVVLEVNYAIIPQKLIAGVRWNHLDADEFWGGGTDRRERSIWPDVNEVGVAVKYLIHGEALKLTMDVLHVSQQLTFGQDPGTSETLRGAYNNPPVRGAFGGSGGSDYNNLWIVRLQLQWMF